MQGPADRSEIGLAVERHESMLRRLAIGDDAYIESATANERVNVSKSGLDRKSHALVRLGALIAADAASPSYLDAVESARDSATTDEELVGCLIAVLPAVGAARVISAAPKLGLALGYDVKGALEDPDPLLD